MDATISIDLSQIRNELKLSQENIERTVELLDEGNTVPFITRYRKDQTGGLDEEQVRAIQQRVERLRALADRKQRILKWIESQGKLTDDLSQRIQKADSIKRLDDLYLPFKGKKQTLANIARQRGLEPLAVEVLNGAEAASDLDARAAELVDPEKGLKDSSDVLQGLRHILAERTIEDLALRDRLRSIVHKSGRLSSVRAERTRPENPAEDDADDAEDRAAEDPASEQEAATSTETAPAEPAATEPAATEPAATEPVATEPVATEPVATEPVATEPAATEPAATEPAATESVPTEESPAEAAIPAEDIAEAPAVESSDEVAADPQTTEESAATEATDQSPATDTAATDTTSAELPSSPAGDEAAVSDHVPLTQSEPADAEAATEGTKKPKGDKKSGQSKPSMTEVRRAQRERKRKKKEQAFKDYFEFSEAVSKLPPHRILALNRGERSRILKVKFEADQAAINAEADKTITEEHPHREFLQSCVKDALARSIVLSLERELRRELTERAEQHAIEVFARNLRKLLLQPPVRSRRILAIDPGFKSGCKVAAIDAFGNLLGHDVIYLVGNDDRKKRGRAKIVSMVKQHNLNSIAIGNGAAYRETEQLVAAIIGDELKGREIAYSIVNEAGSSFYSTSETGREELPNCDALLRSAVSIGRRLQDPLSELVKINPAHIGVGMYQHDVKYKHLQASLDAVVESCVNYVGVDVNTASPALLGYVSGLNQLTARRVYEHRLENGPFKSREELKSVSGLGEQTFTQAAGFLKISAGANPLDATWIHPESYDVAEKVLENFNSSVAELASCVPVPATQEAAATSDTKVETADSAAAETALAAETETPAAETTATETPIAEPVSDAGVSTPTVENSEIAPVTEVPVTEAPAAEAPAAEAPAAEAPATEAPATEVPVTEAPVTEVPVTEVPVTEVLATNESAPATAPSEPVAETTACSVEAEPVAVEPAKSPIAELKIEPTDVVKLAADLNVGQLLLQDILQSLSRPGRDPREDLPAPVFRTGIVKLDDLDAGMELSGTVLNVVDFGAFVDIGLSDSGLVHISRLADKYVGDPHEVVSVGDIIRVWVVEVDKVRRRVSLTAIQPGTERKREPRASRRRPDKKGGRKPEGAKDADKSQGRRSAPKRQPRGRQVRAGSYTPRPPKPKKPVKPITDAMVEGSEPMRSFSDLLQFYEKKTDEPDGQSDDKKSDSK